MNRIIKGFRISVACVFMLSFLGCGTSQPSHFYLLRALSPASASGLSETKQSSLSIGLGPVTFPEYLNRPQIVTKASAHEVELAEFHKWAEPLQDNAANVLQENLSALLSTDRILQYPWKRPSLLDYQLSLDVIQFDGTKSQEAVLKVRWALVGEDGETLLVEKTSYFTEPVGGLDYEDFVQAMSRTLDSLSKELADAIKGLPSESS
jgi:uncharacterized lipoprotein YmbA